MAAVFRRSKDYCMFSVKKTETLFFWRYDIQVNVLMKEWELKLIPEMVEIKFGKVKNKLNVILQRMETAMYQVLENRTSIGGLWKEVWDGPGR